MVVLSSFRIMLLVLCVLIGGLAPVKATAQSFNVQCPATTALHPGSGQGNQAGAAGTIKCQEVSGGDGFATMADGTQMFLFGFGPLSGLADIQAGLPGTETAEVFNDPTNANHALTSVSEIMNTGVLNAESPAPTMAIDEDDEFFLTLTNVGMIMRPDLFEQHTIHFHGYPNASSFFDGVPDASVAVNIGGSFTYYYTAPEAGTYFWHCHISPPEHLQMGMVGQLYVRPRQNRVRGNLYDALVASNKAKGSVDGLKCSDILCTNETPPPLSRNNNAGTPGTTLYAYNDGDGSTQYDVEYPIQMMGFDPSFHFVSTTFNPEGFADMKDKYFMLSGRSYPDTINKSYISTEGSDGTSRPSQPVRSLITINKSKGQNRALLRISDLDVTEFSTLATIGIPMTVIAQDARLLRDSMGNNMYFNTNSITMGGGQSTDVILDASNVPKGTYFLYTTNLDHLSNDAENFGGQMTEIHVE
jgi:hypothetical protein